MNKVVINHYLNGSDVRFQICSGNEKPFKFTAPIYYPYKSTCTLNYNFRDSQSGIVYTYMPTVYSILTF